MNDLQAGQEFSTGLPLVAKGKVRELYRLDDSRFLMVASDRISTYDCVHPTVIPDKGRILAGISCFWFEYLKDLVPNHVLEVPIDVAEELRGRSLVVKQLEMLPVECVVRGYLAGSGWKDYLATGSVCGIELPQGLAENQQLPEPIFTPATKAEVGDHDLNIGFEQAVEIVGDRQLVEELKRLSIEIYSKAAAHALSCGIVLADTKFEFGIDRDGTLVLADEVLTPDSSRFWPLDGYQPGQAQQSFDKQYVRDWVTASGWDKNPPAPALPAEVVQQTRQKYIAAYKQLTGEPFEQWLKRSGVTSSI